MTSRALVVSFALLTSFLLNCGSGGDGGSSIDEGDGCSGPDRSDICEPGPPPMCPSIPAESRCTPGESRPCYDGKAGTEGTGACQGGMRICNDEGSAFGECTGQTLARPTTCSAPAAFDCTGAAPTCGGASLQVTSQVTSPALNVAWEGTAVALDQHGNLVVAAQGSTPEDHGLVSVSKLDPVGNTLWSKTVANTVEANTVGDGAIITALAVGTDDHILLAGHVDLATIDFGGGSLGNPDRYTAFAVALDDAGNHLWSKDYQAITGDTSLPDSVSSSVAVDAAGDVYLAGTSGQGYQATPISLNPDFVSSDVIHGFVTRLDPAGNPVWSAGLSVPAGDSAQGIALDAAGNVYVTGYAYYTTGDANPSFGSLCMYAEVLLASFDATGVSRWSKIFGAGRQQGAGTGIAVGPTGDLFVAGLLQPGLDFGPGPLPGGGLGGFLARFDASGEHVWSRGFEALLPVGLGLDSAGDIVIAGAESRVVKLLPSNEVYMDRIGALDPSQADDFHAGALAVGPSGSVALTGGYKGTIDFGLGKLPSSMNESEFVLMLDP